MQKEGAGWESILSWGAIVAALTAVTAAAFGLIRGLWGLGRWVENAYRGLAKLDAWIDESRVTADLLRARDSLLVTEAPVEMIWLGPDGLLLPERSDTVSRLTQESFKANEHEFRRNGWARRIAIKGGTNEDFEEWLCGAIKHGEDDTVSVVIRRDDDEPLERNLLFRPVRVGTGEVLGITIIFRHTEWRGGGLR